MLISARCTQVERSRTKIIKVREDKSPLVNQQCFVYHFQCSLCDVGYVDYTYRHLHQRMEEHKGSAIGNHMTEQHNIAPNGTVRSLKILRKCQNKLDCPIFVTLFFIKASKPTLNNSVIPSAQNYLFRSVLRKPRYCLIVSLFYVLFFNFINTYNRHFLSHFSVHDILTDFNCCNIFMLSFVFFLLALEIDLGEV